MRCCQRGHRHGRSRSAPPPSPWTCPDRRAQLTPIPTAARSAAPAPMTKRASLCALRIPSSTCQRQTTCSGTTTWCPSARSPRVLAEQLVGDRFMHHPHARRLMSPMFTAARLVTPAPATKRASRCGSRIPSFICQRQTACWGKTVCCLSACPPRCLTKQPIRYQRRTHPRARCRLNPESLAARSVAPAPATKRASSCASRTRSSTCQRKTTCLKMTPGRSRPSARPTRFPAISGGRAAPRPPRAAAELLAMAQRQ
mmetsp:Transcript_53122/g.161385  ORF Transcript_53122/g.161385 Transcript_53122/m.161385 type:complete len:256 (+) Transcript_53122:512-1279(+)